MIKEAHCSFEVAKLLKERGFNNDYPKGDCTQIACTHQMATAWLREIHNFHITIIFSEYLYGSHPFYWSIDRMIDDKREKTSTATGDYTYKSYEEAIEAAIKYALENLI